MKIKPIATEEDQEETRRLKAEFEQRQRLDDIRFILGTIQGRRYFRRLAIEAKPFGVNYTTNERDHAFLDGNKNALLKQLAEVIAASPTVMSDILGACSDSSENSGTNKTKE